MLQEWSSCQGSPHHVPCTATLISPLRHPLAACCSYYSYKWAEVLSADAFAAFEEAGLDNEEAVAETGGWALCSTVSYIPMHTTLACENIVSLAHVGACAQAASDS